MAESAQIIHCWTTIGVWGRERPRCPLLEQVVHCRNCEKYIAAGKQALQRPATAEYARDWAKLIAAPHPVRAEHLLTVLVFRVGDEWFSLPTHYLQSIERRRRIHTLPHSTSALVKGVVNVAGEVCACFSIGSLLGIERPSAQDSAERTAVPEGLLVMRRNKSNFVFPVTEIKELIELDLADITPVPSTVKPSAASYLLGIFELGKLHIGHLDADLVIAGFERGDLSQGVVS